MGGDVRRVLVVLMVMVFPAHGHRGHSFRGHRGRVLLLLLLFHLLLALWVTVRIALPPEIESRTFSGKIRGRSPSERFIEARIHRLRDPLVLRRGGGRAFNR